MASKRKSRSQAKAGGALLRLRRLRLPSRRAGLAGLTLALGAAGFALAIALFDAGDSGSPPPADEGEAGADAAAIADTPAPASEPVDLGDAVWGIAEGEGASRPSKAVQAPAATTPDSTDGDGASAEDMAVESEDRSARAETVAPSAGLEAAARTRARPRAPESAAVVPAWRRLAAPVPGGEHPERPKVAVIIDDLGPDRARTGRAIVLKAPLTLSFLPYAEGLPELARAARLAGHELLVHMPMAPDNGYADPGPHALAPEMSRDEIHHHLAWALDRFDGYVGINNHMGSRFTREAKPMRWVLAEIKSRGLLYIDSRTTPETVGADIARDLGVPFTERDVFLDNERSAEGLLRRLLELEQIAREHGSAVAIGHPNDATLEALSDWLTTLEEKGLQLVPVSALVRERQEAPAPTVRRSGTAG